MIAAAWSPGFKDTHVLVHTGGLEIGAGWGQSEHATDKGVLGLFSVEF